MIFFRQIVCEFDSRYSVVIEDDGRVCYAYLLLEGEIVGDVWLYNVSADPPANADWNSKGDMPFLNPRDYVSLDHRIRPITNESEVFAKWKRLDQEIKEVDIFVRGQLVARLAVGMRPGWSTLVLKDGPLARRLRLTD